MPDDNFLNLNLKFDFKNPQILEKVQSAMRYAISQIMQNAVTEQMHSPKNDPEHKKLWIRTGILKGGIQAVPAKISGHLMAAGVRSRAKYSAKNEMGWGCIARPFLKPAMIENRDKIIKRFRSVIKNI